MFTSDLEEFSFEKWYPLFLQDSIEAVILPVPNNVLQYLREGSLVLPQEAITNPHLSRSSNEQHYTVDWSSVDDTPELQQPSYPAFSAQLKDAINTVGGDVFVKMNWSAPKDAAWITASKSLKCSSLEDVYLVLKASEVLIKDINYEFKGSCQLHTSSIHCVVLKRWTDMHPGSEFRCFVMDHVLVAISQRDCGAYYKHIDNSKYKIMEDIIKFFERKVMKKFPHPDYTFDIVRNDGHNIVIIDFNPLDEHVTKSLLFTWDELKNKKSSEAIEISGERSLSEQCSNYREPEFRFLGEDPGLQPNPCKHFGVPYEVEELCSRQSQLSLIDYVVEERERQDSSDDTV